MLEVSVPRTETQICQSVNASLTYFHWNSWLSATIYPESFEPWYLRRCTSQARSALERNEAVSGESYIRKNDKHAMITVRMPSRMKIHLHPSNPPIPSIFCKWCQSLSNCDDRAFWQKWQRPKVLRKLQQHLRRRKTRPVWIDTLHGYTTS